MTRTRDVESESTPRLIEARIEQHYESLPQSERRVADLILDFPGNIASFTATELATLAGGSKAAVTRLVRRLGFANYNEARRLARDAQQWGSPLYLMTQSTGPETHKAQIDAQIQNDVDCLTRTLSNLHSVDLDGIVKALVEAERVLLVGFRNNHMMAHYARWQLIQVRDHVHLVPLAGETIAESLAGLSQKDLLLVVGIRRRPHTLHRVMELAHDAGTPILYITDPTASGSARLADWTIRCQVRGASLFDSYAAVISVLHFLSSAVVFELKGSGRARLTHIEKLHDELAEFT